VDWIQWQAVVNTVSF